MNLLNFITELSRFADGMIVDTEVVVAHKQGGDHSEFKGIRLVRSSRGIIIIDATAMVTDTALNVLNGKVDLIDTNIPDNVNTTKALDTQVDGNHYKDFPIQPVEYCERNNLNTCQSNMIKYTTRLGLKGDKTKTADDLRKIIHYAELYAQLHGIEL